MKYNERFVIYDVSRCFLMQGDKWQAALRGHRDDQLVVVRIVTHGSCTWYVFSNQFGLLTCPDSRDTAMGNTTYVFRTVRDRKSTRLNSSHVDISYAVFCLK